MTNENDLIRRGDVLAACQLHNSARAAEITIAALPAVTPAVTVKPLEWEQITERRAKAAGVGRIYIVKRCEDGSCHWRSSYMGRWEIAKTEAEAKHAAYEHHVKCVIAWLTTPTALTPTPAAPYGGSND